MTRDRPDYMRLIVAGEMGSTKVKPVIELLNRSCPGSRWPHHPPPPESSGSAYLNSIVSQANCASMASGSSFRASPSMSSALLLEQPGEVVSREELQKRLWQADTFVDFEHSLNAAIKRLRAALGDSADSPRFIETLARRGYRFIAPLTKVAAPPERAAPATAPRTAGARSATRFPACRRHCVGHRVGRGSRPHRIGRAETSHDVRFDPLPGRTSAGEPLGRSGSGLLLWKA